jgi:hypothetical protein
MGTEYTVCRGLFTFVFRDHGLHLTRHFYPLHSASDVPEHAFKNSRTRSMRFHRLLNCSLVCRFILVWRTLGANSSGWIRDTDVTLNCEFPTLLFDIFA